LKCFLWFTMRMYPKTKQDVRKQMRPASRLASLILNQENFNSLSDIRIAPKTK